MSASRLCVMDAGPRDIAWLVDRLGFQVTSDIRGLVAFERKTGRIHGVVGYCNWTQNSVICHTAADTPIAWRALVLENQAPIFRYPFLVAQKEVILATIRGSNRKSLSLVQHLGFVEVARIPNGYAKGDDMLIYTMHRDQCRYLGPAAVPEPVRRTA